MRLDGLTLNQRHDLLWWGKKVSGSAYRLIRNHGLHHGTMLLQTQLSEIGSLLQSTPGYYSDQTTTMVTSVRSEVANVANGQISFIEWQQMISRHLGVEAMAISEAEMQGEAGVRERYTQLTDPTWIFRTQ